MTAGTAVINVASIGGFQPAPYLAVYSASKAFVLTFSQALWGEYRSCGILVLALCPRPVDTGFFDILGDKAAIGQHVPVEQVVRHALHALDTGRIQTVPGCHNHLLTQLPRLLPRQLLVTLTERTTRAVTRTSWPAEPTGTKQYRPG